MAGTGLLLPLARQLYNPITGRTTLVPTSVTQIQALPEMVDGGRAAKPEGMIHFVGPDGRQILLVANGETEMAELQDIALEAMEKPQPSVAEKRARRGLPPAEKVDGILREAAEDGRLRRQRRK